jgi:hypothetical protein
MLRTETVERSAFELLKTLMQDERLSDFILAGGTNLALQIGHRLSIDLDLFPFKPFETDELLEHLVQKYDFRLEMKRERNTIMGYISDVKVDLVAHVYPPLQNHLIVDDIRLYSLADIAAMKLNAISDSGTRLKDFVDITYLSTKMSLSEMLSHYASKYPNTNWMRALRGLSYFEEIDFSTKIDLCSGKEFEWKKIEQRIKDMIKFENKIFETTPI